jgi:transcriptional regulator
MYVPAHFAVTDRDTLHEFIETHNFGSLISQLDGEPFATHVPFLLRAEQGILVGHMAKANPQWWSAEGQSVLALFSGPHAYISPSWYRAPNVVPTWNYVAVHVYGTFHAIHDTQGLTEIVRDSVAQFEGPDSAWKLDPAGDFIQKLLPQIVGFRIEIARMEGKWKLNQNHSREHRENVIRALRAKTNDDSQAIADLMARRL